MIMTIWPFQATVWALRINVWCDIIYHGDDKESPANVWCDKGACSDISQRWQREPNVWCDKGAYSHISWRWRRTVMIVTIWPQVTVWALMTNVWPMCDENVVTHWEIKVIQAWWQSENRLDGWEIKIIQGGCPPLRPPKGDNLAVQLAKLALKPYI